jgi:hypothetical protein
MIDEAEARNQGDAANPLARNSYARLGGKCDVMRVKLHPLFELARLLVRFDHVACFHRKRESQASRERL